MEVEVDRSRCRPDPFRQSLSERDMRATRPVPAEKDPLRIVVLADHECLLEALASHIAGRATMRERQRNPSGTGAFADSIVHGNPRSHWGCRNTTRPATGNSDWDRHCPRRSAGPKRSHTDSDHEGTRNGRRRAVCRRLPMRSSRPAAPRRRKELRRHADRSKPRAPIRIVARRDGCVDRQFFAVRTGSAQRMRDDGPAKPIGGFAKSGTRCEIIDREHHVQIVVMTVSQLRRPAG